MKKSLLIVLAVFGIGFIAYQSGPKPDAPDFRKVYNFDLPTDLNELEWFIEQRESEIPGIKTDNEAQFVWADTIKTITEYAIVYIHGFSASHEEGAPVHENLAKKYGANLYKARLASHGIDLEEETLLDFDADAYIKSAEEALAIGHKIGKKVIIVATSAGSAQSILLASKHQDIEAMVLYSPCIAIFDETAKMLDDPWGLKVAQLVKGTPFNDITERNAEHEAHWSLHYRLESLVELQSFLTHAMIPEVFEKVKCPIFMGYYYEDEENQDHVVSVPAMLKMFEELGSNEKTKVVFPTAKDHVLASYVLSSDWESVQERTELFLDNIVK